MKINLTPGELIDQLRAWFFPKDRSIYLADNCSVYLPGPYQLATARISETILSVAVPNITIPAPQTFRSLILVCQLRTDQAAEISGIGLRFNGDSGANYDSQLLRVNNTTLSGGATRAGTNISIAISEGNNSRASNFSGFEVTIPGYALTDREKWAFCPVSAAFGNVSADADLFIDSHQGRWRSTAAITSLTLVSTAGANFVAGSRVTLYGVL